MPPGLLIFCLLIHCSLHAAVISLNGAWKCQGVAAADKETIPSAWGHTIPVPGLADLAQPAPGAYDYLFYQKTFTISGAVPPVVLLKVHKAFWGKKVWINGAPAGEHHPNFTPGYFDIGPRVLGNGRENTLVIRVGKQGTQPPGWNIGSDFEKAKYIPGIYDNVDLIATGEHRVAYVQTAPDIVNKRLRVLAHVKNHGASASTIPLTIEVREAASSTLAGSGSASITLAAGAEGDAFDTVSLPDCRLWTPESPFLYTLRIMTPNDTFSTRTGMRTFSFDPATKKPLLNGNIYMLRGTNFTMYRFFEDGERAELPWNKEWAAALIKKYKSLHINSCRYCIGFPPEIWYEAADEEGLLVQDEYPIWRLFDGLDNQCNDATITPEIKDWIRERNNHPCVFLWDIQNETSDGRTNAIIRNCMGLDLQNRPWDNGWAPAQSPVHTSELHTYFNQNSIGWTTDSLSAQPLIDQNAVPKNPVILNEYAWIWINRDGSPTSLTVNQWNAILPGAAAGQRRYYHDLHMAQETEWFRCQRHAGVMHFCGLGYNRPVTGQTCDELLPGIGTPALAPSFETLMRDAFAPVGLMIRYWKRAETPGASRTVEVFAMNDKSAPWSGTVTLKITTLTSALVQSMTGTFTNVATGYRANRTFSIAFPPTPGHYKLVAEYVENNDTVQSVRDFKIQGADLAAGKPIAASSSLSGFPASNANDGNLSTQWSSEPGDTQWIRVDLGPDRKISQVELNWSLAYGKEYQIQTSADDHSWTTVYTRKNGAGGNEILEFAPSTCRYVRFYGTRQGINAGYTITDFRVYEAPLVNVAPAAARQSVSPLSVPTIVAVAGRRGWIAMHPGTLRETRRFTVYNMQGKRLRNITVNGRGSRDGKEFRESDGIYLLTEVQAGRR